MSTIIGVKKLTMQGCGGKRTLAALVGQYSLVIPILESLFSALGIRVVSLVRPCRGERLSTFPAFLWKLCTWQLQ